MAASQYGGIFKRVNNAHFPCRPIVRVSSTHVGDGIQFCSTVSLYEVLAVSGSDCDELIFLDMGMGQCKRFYLPSAMRSCSSDVVGDFHDHGFFSQTKVCQHQLQVEKDALKVEPKYDHIRYLSQRMNSALTLGEIRGYRVFDMGGIVSAQNHTSRTADFCSTKLESYLRRGLETYAIS